MRLNCHECGREFEKADKEYKRQQNRGRNHFFCGLSCTASYANKIRHNTPDDGLKPHQRKARKIENILGEKLSTAKSRLVRMLLFEMARKCSMDVCYRCGQKIISYDDFTIDHKISWASDDKPTAMFYDIDNIAFSHSQCNSEAGVQAYVANRKNKVKECNGLYIY